MKSIITSILLFWILQAGAQDVYILKIEQSQDLGELCYKISQVIDSTQNRGSYGFVHTGLANRKRIVKFSPSIDGEITKFLSKNSFYNPFGQSIELVIKELSVIEKIGLFRETGEIKFVVDYYSNNKVVFRDFQEKKYRLIGDVTRGHKTILGNIIYDSFSKLNTHLLK